MKTVKKNVYYCDFCNKRMLSKGAMNTHEKHCTSNINRECRMCGNRIQFKEEADKLKERYKLITYREEWGECEKIEWIGKPIIIEELFDICEGCPACVLSLLKASGLTHPIFHNEIKFDYKKEKSDWWIAVDADKRMDFNTYTI
ncbi:MAG: hypothetical protein PHS30_04715 [Bacteroidales bacterium]|nr:hypothetical protein [Bacteroidales bacterium]